MLISSGSFRTDTADVRSRHLGAPRGLTLSDRHRETKAGWGFRLHTSGEERAT